jgi:ABC-type transporter Mla MlaB component
LIIPALDIVAFPLFGKKPSPAPLGAKSPARPAGKEEAASRDEFGSLDFTHTQDPNSMTSRPRIEVKETIHEIPQAIEQAAMLYSIEQADAASDALEAVVRTEELGRYAARAWGMLFELYQLQSRRQDFDRLAADFAAKFETSPPTWSEGDEAAAVVRKAPIGKTSVSLSGALSAKAKEPLGQVLRIAEKNPAVRLDVSKVTEVDEQGCAELNAVLKAIKRARKECVLGGADKLAALVVKTIEPGLREREEAWLLLLELYQQLASQEAFEDTAVNYAVTFEVSPPSFEMPKTRPASVADKAEPEEEIELDADNAVCALEGVISASSDKAFAQIRLCAESVTEVQVDVSRLKRMDFVAATNLMNLVSALTAAKKRVRLIKASHLLTALWEVIGLDRVAHIEVRKA